jgi:hypothetical protein
MVFIEVDQSTSAGSTSIKKPVALQLVFFVAGAGLEPATIKAFCSICYDLINK